MTEFLTAKSEEPWTTGDHSDLNSQLALCGCEKSDLQEKVSSREI